MSEMVERVAKAIQAKCVERGYREVPVPLVHHVAAASIEAMREPTGSMISASAKCNIDPEMTLHKQRWQAMIDAALNPSQT